MFSQLRGFGHLSISKKQKVLRQTDGMQERLHLSGGLGIPWCPLGRVKEGGRIKAGSGPGSS